MSDPRNEATERQVQAADPARSTWLTANAGSGKTRVLIDRVARLLLAGTRPERILCLTYTKAAATEMQNRLLARLGAWAMLPDDRLRAELDGLGASGGDLAAARRLFAQAIEAPGGLKVQTIHSFCAGVLRRFPLEAGVPHGFRELDDRSAAKMRAEVIEEMAEEALPEMGDLAALHSGDRLDRLLSGLTGGFQPLPDGDLIWRATGLEPGDGFDAMLAAIFLGDERDLIGALIPPLLGSGPNDCKAGQRLRRGDWAAPGLPEAAILESVLLNGSSAKIPFGAKIGSFPTKALRQGPCAALMPDLEALMLRVEAARPRRIALDHALATLRLHRFAAVFCARYADRKTAHGWLDFDDLIVRTARLLSDSALAQWVLFRLDGGIDHILVDEAQDTSPTQWQVIERLTEEFTAGAGDRNRTLFVVGDPKQSIYSFQGADIAVFEERRHGFSAAFAQARRPMQPLELEYSFRSSPAILRLVDGVFAGDAARGLGQAALHKAYKSALPGRVDLWPVFDPPPDPEETDWRDPVDQTRPDSAPARLADEIASAIRHMLNHGMPIIDARTGVARPVRAGDILILVQKRGTVFAEMIRACKAAGLPIAGADRLRLAAEMAVRDIRSVLAFLATPEDDLALAEALRSPLFGLDEDDLYRLAAKRAKGEYLWARLRHSGHEAARAITADLLAQADYLRPYELISRLLVRHGGRDRLVARLGSEAEDGIDELLSQALAYETTEAPSLTGFLVWLSGDDVEVKRQADSRGGLIRVMTVHGSKGLESPVVILPDTARPKDRGETGPLRPQGAPALWRGVKNNRPEIAEQAVADEARRRAEERKRLLYVALTRAESWLIVAAAGETGTGEESWYAMVEAGTAQTGLPETAVATGFGAIRRFFWGDWPETAEAPPAELRPEPAIPAFLRERAAPVDRPPVPVTATGLGGAKALPGGDADPGALLHGTRLHLLLEHLSGGDPAGWPAQARAILSGGEGGLPAADELARLLDEARAVMDAPDLAGLFQPPPGATVLREAALTAPLPGLGVLNGTVDRLIVAPDAVTAIDYKSNAVIPDRPEDTPAGILRQMAAYRAALRLIWPGRRVDCAILWTRGPSLMWLPDGMLDRVPLDPAGVRP